MSDMRTILVRGVGGAAPPPDGFERMLRRRDRKRRSQRIAAGVVGIAVFVAAIWIVTTGGPFDRTEQPAVPGPTIPPARAPVGFIGLPPEGATPSTPETGELVLSLYGGSTTAGGLLTLMYVYADGRLIWDTEGDLPFGATKFTTGFLEQRLTLEGIELVRSEIVSTGLFDHDLALLSTPRVGWGTIQVRNGDRLVRVEWSPDKLPADGSTVATPEQASALERLDALLTDPASWVPASAWEDSAIRAYVPSRYAVCYTSPDRAVEQSRMLTLLPARAEELLRARDQTKYEVPFHGNIYCSQVTTEQARAIAGAFDDAGLAQNPDSIGLRLSYLVDPPGLPIGRSSVQIFFEPYLPHGEFLLCKLCSVRAGPDG